MQPVYGTAICAAIKADYVVAEWVNTVLGGMNGSTSVAVAVVCRRTELHSHRSDLVHTPPSTTVAIVMPVMTTDPLQQRPSHSDVLTITPLQLEDEARISRKVNLYHLFGLKRSY